MSALESLLEQPLVIRAGWTLVHFLWQGSAIAIVLAVVRAAAGTGWKPAPGMRSPAWRWLSWPRRRP